MIVIRAGQAFSRMSRMGRSITLDVRIPLHLLAVGAFSETAKACTVFFNLFQWIHDDDGAVCRMYDELANISCIVSHQLEYICPINIKQ